MKIKKFVCLLIFSVMPFLSVLASGPLGDLQQVIEKCSTLEFDDSTLHDRQQLALDQLRMAVDEDYYLDSERLVPPPKGKDPYIYLRRATYQIERIANSKSLADREEQLLLLNDVLNDLKMASRSIAEKSMVLSNRAIALSKCLNKF
jgi:hypothetical protein